jgi:Ca2+-binding EF-hand superfamily protein
MEVKKELDKKYLKEFDPQDMADFEEAFDLFDIDGDGTISTTELKNLLRCFGKKATDDVV